MRSQVPLRAALAIAVCLSLTLVAGRVASAQLQLQSNALFQNPYPSYLVNPSLVNPYLTSSPPLISQINPSLLLGNYYRPNQPVFTGAMGGGNSLVTIGGSNGWLPTSPTGALTGGLGASANGVGPLQAMAIQNELVNSNRPLAQASALALRVYQLEERMERVATLVSAITRELQGRNTGGIGALGASDDQTAPEMIALKVTIDATELYVGRNDPTGQRTVVAQDKRLSAQAMFDVVDAGNCQKLLRHSSSNYLLNDGANGLLLGEAINGYLVQYIELDKETAVLKGQNGRYVIATPAGSLFAVEAEMDKAAKFSIKRIDEN